MRIRSARSLVFVREAGQILAYNFLTNTACSCTRDVLSFLEVVEDWSTIDEVAGAVSNTASDIEHAVKDLLTVHLIVEEGSPLARTEAAFKAEWRWGLPAALFHFSLQDRPFMTLQESEALQRAKVEVEPSPPLFLTNDWANGRAIRLPAALGDNDLLDLMARRRTVRSATPSSITVDQLSDCLFAGLGITGWAENCVGRLPLAMTPSGGGRNPYEAYVYARAVEGLAPGIYHYAAVDHTLAPLDADALPPFSQLLGGQDWADQMPCLVVLCAWLERSMWKYEDANAYRVVLIEAGHIGQNVMLAATRHGLTACPTAALDQAVIKKSLPIDRGVTHAPIYALALGHPQVVPSAGSH